MASIQNPIYDSAWSNQDALQALGMDLQEDLGLPASMQSEFTGELSPGILGSGELIENITLVGGGKIKQGKTNFDNTETGFIIGDDAGTPKFYIGDTANYMNWDGSNLTINKAIMVDLGSGSDLAIQGWQFSGIFSATDYRIVAWASGTIDSCSITLMDGTTFSIDAGNTGNMSALTYIYFDKAISETVLQTTTTAATAVGSNKILIAVAQNNADTAKDATFQVYGGSGGVGTFITADNIAASAITANEIAANTIVANNIAASAITANEISLGLYNQIDANWPSDANLALYWSFDEGAGLVAIDGSSKGNNGTLNGAMTAGDWIPGKSGTMLDFDGTDDYVSKASPSFVDDTQGAVSLWVKIDNLAAIQTIWAINEDGAASGDHFSLFFRGDSNKMLDVYLDINGTTVMRLNTAVNAINDNNLHYIVVTSDGSTIKLYVDSVELTLTAATGSNSGQWFANATDANQFNVGVYKYSSLFAPLNGDIDEPRVYSTGLTAPEVYALYKNPGGQKKDSVPMGKLTSGSIYSKQITLAVADGTGDSYIASGKTDFTNTQSGFILGLDDSDSDKAKFYIGDATTYLNWTGAALVVKGSITITSGSGIASLSDAGDLAVLDTVSNAYITDLAVSKLTAGTISSKAITLAIAAGTGDSKIQAGKTDFDNTQSGFILGLDDSDSDLAKFYIGNTTNYLNWDGLDLTIKGSITGSTITGATITGSTLQTGTSGANVNIETSRLAVRNNSTEMLVLEKGTYGGYLFINDINGVNVFALNYNSVLGSITYWGQVGDLSFQSADDIIFVLPTGGSSHFYPNSDNQNSCGTAGSRWSDVRSVLINGADYGFEHNWYLTENYKVGIEEKGIAVLNENNELMAFIGENNFYTKEIKNIDELSYVKTTLKQRAQMDLFPELRKDFKDKKILEMPNIKDAKIGGGNYKEKFKK